MNDKKKRALENLLFHCGSLTSDDNALMLCDPGTRDIANAFVDIALSHKMNFNLLEIPALKNHGSEPPEYAENQMRSATLIMSLCTFSLAHSKARIRAAEKGARFLSLPLYTWDLLEEPCLHIDFKSQAPRVRNFSNAFTHGKKIHVVTEAGTDIVMNIQDRAGNYCPGFVERAGDLGSPPDIEANVSPIENSAEGVAIIDGSITHPDFGLLQYPVKLTVKNGKIVAFESQNQKYVESLNTLFGPIDSKRRVLAECGVGLNPAAKLTGTMLTDEGALGYLHFGFGANHTVGGLNEVDFHLDFVFRATTLSVDSHVLIQSGMPLI